MSNTEIIFTPGRDELWNWFGLSYASFLTIPRVLMHEMPDDWQGRMAQLLQEYDEHFPGRTELPSPFVSARQNNRFVRWPHFLLNYRYPDAKKLAELNKPPKSIEWG